MYILIGAQLTGIMFINIEYVSKLSNFQNQSIQRLEHVC